MKLLGAYVGQGLCYGGNGHYSEAYVQQLFEDECPGVVSREKGRTPFTLLKNGGYFKMQGAKSPWDLGIGEDHEILPSFLREAKKVLNVLVRLNDTPSEDDVRGILHTYGFLPVFNRIYRGDVDSLIGSTIGMIDCDTFTFGQSDICPADLRKRTVHGQAILRCLLGHPVVAEDQLAQLEINRAHDQVSSDDAFIRALEAFYYSHLVADPLFYCEDRIRDDFPISYGNAYDEVPALHALVGAQSMDPYLRSYRSDDIQLRRLLYYSGTLLVDEQKRGQPTTYRSLHKVLIALSLTDDNPRYVIMDALRDRRAKLMEESLIAILKIFQDSIATEMRYYLHLEKGARSPVDLANADLIGVAVRRWRDSDVLLDDATNNSK